MSSNSIVDSLHLLPPSRRSAVLRSLRQEKLVWAQLEDKAFRSQWLKLAETKASEWNAFGVFLFQAGFRNLAFFDQPANTLPESLLAASLEVYDNFRTDPDQVTDIDLDMAGKFALAIYSQQKIYDGWSFLLNDLEIKPPAFWKPVFAILIQLLPDPQTLIHSLINAYNIDQYAGLCSHALLCKAWPLEQSVQTFWAAISALNADEQLIIIQSILPVSQQFSKKLARKLISTMEPVDVLLKTSHFHENELLIIAEIYQQAGKNEEAIQLLDAAWETSRKHQLTLTSRLNAAATLNGQTSIAEKALTRFSTLKSQSVDTAKNLVIDNTNNEKSLTKEIKGTENQYSEFEHLDPVAVLVQAKRALHAGDLETAKGIMEAALQNGTKFELEEQHYFSPMLLALGFVEEAAAAAGQSLKVYPNDQQNLKALAEAYYLLGDFSGAASTAQLALQLDPEIVENKKFFGQILSKMGFWTEAYRTLAELPEDKLDAEVQLLLAKACVEQNKTEEAKKITTSIIRSAPNNALAHALLAEALFQEGLKNDAEEFFQQALQLDAKNPEIIVAYSHFLASEQNIAAALEKTMAASLADPENAKLHLVLGDLYAAQSQYNQALTEYQHVISLLPANEPKLGEDAFRQLTKTLVKQGHLEDAKKRISEGMKKYPKNMVLKQLNANILAFNNEYALSFACFDELHQQVPEDAALLQDYAEAMIAEGKQAEKSVQITEQLAILSPNNPEVKTLLAEAYAMQGDLEKSITLFDQAISDGLDQNPKWSLRIRSGKAKAALKSGHTALAIDALRTLLLEQPNELSLLKLITVAYIEADNTINALDTLDHIHSIHGNKLVNLIWIADQAVLLGASEMAEQLLLEAKQLQPDNSNTISRLAVFYKASSNETLAKSIFLQLLTIDDPQTDDLETAFFYFKEIGDFDTGIKFLLRAIENNDSKSDSLKLLLSQQYYETAEFELCLESLADISNVFESRYDVYELQANTLIKLGRNSEAQDALKQMTLLQPDNVELLILASKISRTAKDLSSALKYAEQAYQLDSANPLSREQYAILSHANIEPAQEITAILNAKSTDQTAICIVMKILYQLESGEFEGAKDSCHALELHNKNPLHLAIRSIFFSLEGDREEAQIEFNQALSIYENSIDPLHDFEHADLLLETLLLAARNNFDWVTCTRLADKLAQYYPGEPRPQLIRLQALVDELEFGQLCNDALAITHAPTPRPESQHVYDDIMALFSQLMAADIEFPYKEVVNRWDNRYKLSTNNFEFDKSTPMNSSAEIAAQIAAFRRINRIDQALELASLQDTNPGVLIQLALTLMNTDQVEAQGAAFKAAQLNSNNPISHAVLALAAYKAEEYGLAYDSYLQALTHWENEPQWQFMAGTLQNNNGYHSSAINHFEQAYLLDPKNPEYILQLGKCYLANQSVDKSIELLEQAVIDRPEHTDYWALLARAYQSVEKHSDAARCIDTLISLVPDDISSYLTGASIHLAAGKLHIAENLLEAAFAIDPENPDAFLLKAKIQVEKNKPENAIEILDKAISGSKAPLTLMIERAKLIPLLHGEAQGLRTLKSIAKEYPNEPILLKTLTDAFIRNGEKQEAIKTAQYALKMNYGKLELDDLVNLHMQLGKLLAESGQNDLAIYHLNEAIKNTPSNIEAYLELARVYATRRQHSEAINQLKQAIGISPNDPRPHVAAGNLLKDAKDYESARAMFERASELAPRDVEIQRKLAAVTALTLFHPIEGRGLR